jgi:hypothetical protein
VQWLEETPMTWNSDRALVAVTAILFLLISTVAWIYIPA